MVGILELTFFLPQLDASCGQVDFHWHIYGNLDTNIFAFLCNVRFHLKSDILTDSDYLRCCPDLTPYEMSEVSCVHSQIDLAVISNLDSYK